MAKVKEITKSRKPVTARTRSLAPGEPDEKKEDEVFDAAAADRAEKEVQPPLIPDSEVEVKIPKPVSNKRFVSTYTNCSLMRDKKNEKLITLMFSAVLTPEHEDLVPEKIFDARQWLLKQDNKLVQVDHIPAQTVDVFDGPKSETELLHFIGAKVEKSVVSIVEESGKGKAQKVARLMLHFTVERTAETVGFAAWNDGQQYWLIVKDTQKRLK